MYAPSQTNISNHGNNKKRKNDNNVVTSSGIITKMNTHQNNTWVHKQCVTTVYIYIYIILFLTWHTIFIGMAIKRWSSYINVVSSYLCLRSAGDVTMYCWWRQKAITRPDKWDASTWKSISNSLYVDFIEGHMHGRSIFLSNYIYLRSYDTCCSKANGTPENRSREPYKIIQSFSFKELVKEKIDIKSHL